jgi:hypothetical protein
VTTFSQENHEIGTNGAPSGRRRRRRRIALVVGAVVVVAALGWLGISLVITALHARTAARTVRTDLDRYEAALGSGDVAAAAGWLRAADAPLAAANGDTRTLAVRVAGHLPVLSGPVDDLRRLVAAADLVSRAAGQALSVYNRLDGGHALYRDNTFDLPLLAATGDDTQQIQNELAAARGLLQGVHGGWLEPGVAGMRTSALAQVSRAQRRIRTLNDLLRLLPSVLGVDGPRNYLVVALNPAEERYSGGSPLAIIDVRLDQGRMTLQQSGETSVLTSGNTPLSWKPVPDDPWLHPNAAGVVTSPFVDANFDPSFRISGAELLRAYDAQFGAHADGVIAVDPEALVPVLAKQGPLHVAGYGLLTSDNVVGLLLRQAYVEFPDAVRHALNDLVLRSVFHVLTNGANLLGKWRALFGTAPGRNVQMFFLDPALESLVLRNGLGGVLPAPTNGAVAGIYTQNLNRSKTDYFIRRSITESVRLDAAGDATVVQTAVLTNTSPPYAGPGADPHSGDLTAWDTDSVATVVSSRAIVTGRQLDGRTLSTSNWVTDDGYRVYVSAVALGPGQSATLRLTYRLPAALTRLRNGRLSFVLSLGVQPAVQPGTFTATVQAPPGYTVVPALGWTASRQSETLTMSPFRDEVFTLVFRR